MTIRLQHPTPGAVTHAAELCVSEGGSVLGLIRPDPTSDTFRFFPGSHRHNTFALQHRDVAELIAMVNRQSAVSAPPAADRSA